MKIEKRLILLLFIAFYGIIYSYLFTTSFVTSVLDAANPSWDIISFIPGLADADNYYVIFGTLILSIGVLVCSAGIAGLLMVAHRISKGPVTFRVEAIKPRPSIFELIRRAFVPAMFSFSLGEIAVQYLGQYALGFFRSPGFTSLPIDDRLTLFVMKTFHLSFLFLPLALGLLIPSWILNDFLVISSQKNKELPEYTDRQKVGSWVSGLVSGFSIIAFPLAFLDVFLFTPIENHGWVVVGEILPTILLLMINTLIVLITYVLPIIVFYEFGKTKIASGFHFFAEKLNVENRKILLSHPGDSPEPLIEEAG